MDSKIKQFVEIFEGIDPLYEQIRDLKLLDELLSPCDFYENIIIGNTYKTKQVADLLGIPGKEQKLLNYLNHNEFVSYIKIHRHGLKGYYRYDHITIFQFKMLFLLNDKGYSPSDIAALLNLNTDIHYVEKQTRINTRDVQAQDLYLEEKVDQALNDKLADIIPKLITQFTAREQNRYKKLELQVQMTELNSKKQRWETEMGGLIGRITDIETIQDVLNTLKQTQNPSKQGLFKKLLTSNSLSAEEYEKIINRIDTLKTDYAKLLERKTQLEREKSEIKMLEDQLLLEIKDLEVQQSELINNDTNENTYDSIKEGTGSNDVKETV